MVLAIGPWQWRTVDDLTLWAPPVGVRAALDLRTRDQCAQRGGIGQGFGLFYFTGTGAVEAGYSTIGDFEDTIGLTARRAVEDILGLKRDSIQSSRVADIVFEIMSDHRDPSGIQRHRGLMPDHRGNLELNIGEYRLRREEFNTASPRWSMIREQLREERRDWQRDIPRGLMRPAQLRKCLGFLTRKYKCDHVEFFAQGEQVIDPLPPETTLPASPPETFTYSDGSLNARNSTWSELNGAFNVVSNAVRTNGSLGSTQRCARYESDLSGSDHYAQVDVDDQGDIFGMGGGAVRFSSSAQDYYIIVTRRIGDPYRLYKCTGGTLSQITSQASGTATQSYTNKCEISGSTITLYRNGTTTSWSPTDTTFSGGVRTGIAGHSDSDVKYDNWQAADLSGGGATPTFKPWFLNSNNKLMGGLGVAS